jgi:hypothetical protein
LDSTDIADFSEAVQDVVSVLVEQGAGIAISYNDATNKLNIASTISQYTNEMAQDAIGEILTNSSNITHTYNDASNTISSDLTNSGASAGSYGNTSLVSISVDAKGRITSIANAGSLVIGDNFENFEDLTSFTTTSNSNQNAASFTTASKDIGKYRIGICFSWTVNVTTSDAIFGIYVDNSIVGNEFRMETSDTSNQNIPFNWFSYIDFGSATTHTIQLRTRAEIAGVTVTVNQVIAEIWRVN